jgi:hypothetical protein
VNAYKSFDEIPDLSKKPTTDVKGRDRVALYKPKPKEPVLNSTVNWKPVNKVAARLLYKASWIEKPPESKPDMSHQFPSPADLKSHRGRLKPGGPVYDDLIDKDEIAPFVIIEKAREMSDEIKNTENLVEKAHDVTDALEYLVNHINEPLREYQNWVKNELKAMRENRIALESETRQIMMSLKEVRQFFLDKDYENERARLAEFISLCERLQALKQSGFLDVVADTMLSLAEGTGIPARHPPAYSQRNYSR